jgi:hypothetical protein
MARKNPKGRKQSGSAPPDPKDKKCGRAILAYLLYKHPERLTIPELSRVLNRGGGFNDDDSVERAVRELVGVGLLECEGGEIVPTEAALHFDALESD